MNMSRYFKPMHEKQSMVAFEITSNTSSLIIPAIMKAVKRAIENN